MKKLILEKFKANIIDSAMTISIVGGKKTCCWSTGGCIDCSGGNCSAGSGCISCSSTGDEVCNI